MNDPRILTAMAFYVVGLAAVSLSLRIWWTHPINRVFNLGPFVTEEGLKALLKNVNLIFALGLFALSAGAARHAYWAESHGCGVGAIAHLFGLIELIFALWAAGCVVVVAGRLWLRK